MAHIPADVSFIVFRRCQHGIPPASVPAWAASACTIVLWPLGSVCLSFDESALRLPLKVCTNAALCDGVQVLLGSLLDKVNGDLIRDADIVWAAISTSYGSWTRWKAFTSIAGHSLTQMQA